LYKISGTTISPRNLSAPLCHAIHEGVKFT